ncbi:MAG: hypothetical protein HeimC3_52050 [Candidatus Heimdallarchaeota archaeon LC_3]|nr:MAG: hypothetical protein HeimC3_52050 [Candidatus Heimdallarchaeota archaeon LC_3]
MEDKEHELLKAMGNCYNTCFKDFNESLRMISGWRGYTTDEVKEILLKMKTRYKIDPEYIRLRKKFPEEFPV